MFVLIMIKLRNLSKSFTKNGRTINVLRDLTLDIANGESLAIVGASGAGKSTLLHILGALEHPSAGSVLYDDTDVFQWGPQQLAAFRNKKIGFVFQFHHLLPEFSCLENTMMPALISGIPKKIARLRAEIILNDVGLGDRMPHKPGELSGGEQQRAAVARALMMEPEVLLADEPTGNLDSETGHKIDSLFLDLNRQKQITLIVVTHNQMLAKKMSRSIGLKDGKIIPL